MASGCNEGFSGNVTYNYICMGCCTRLSFFLSRIARRLVTPAMLTNQLISGVQILLTLH